MSLNTLPPEAQLEVLLHLPLSDLVSTCSTSTSLFSLCSDPYFWRRKFAQEGLLLLEEGTTFSSWLAVYRASLTAKRLTELRLSSPVVTVDLKKLNKEDLFLLPYVDKDTYDYYIDIAKERHYSQTQRELAELEAQLGKVSLEDSYVVEEELETLKHLLTLRGFYLLVEMNIYPNVYQFEVSVFLRDFEWHKIKFNFWPITPQERYELIYKAFYYNLVEPVAQ